MENSLNCESKAVASTLQNLNMISKCLENRANGPILKRLPLPELEPLGVLLRDFKHQAQYLLRMGVQAKGVVDLPDLIEKMDTLVQVIDVLTADFVPFTTESKLLNEMDWPILIAYIKQKNSEKALWTSYQDRAKRYTSLPLLRNTVSITTSDIKVCDLEEDANDFAIGSRIFTEFENGLVRETSLDKLKEALDLDGASTARITTAHFVENYKIYRALLKDSNYLLVLQDVHTLGDNSIIELYGEEIVLSKMKRKGFFKGVYSKCKVPMTVIVDTNWRN